MSTAAALIDRLRRHYVPRADRPGGIFLSECGLNDGSAQQRRCDAVQIGFTSTSGRLLRGHEIKVSRADWLTELSKVDKASVWADQCHEWWLVTPDVGIVHAGELPPGWGHMVPEARSGSRFKAVVQATRKPETHQPSWLVVRSIMARLDTLQAQERGAFREQVRTELEGDFTQRLVAAQGQRLSWEQGHRLDVLERVEAELGVSLSDLRADVFVRPDQFVRAVKIARSLETLTRDWNGLPTDAQRLREHADALDTVAALLSQVPA